MSRWATLASAAAMPPNPASPAAIPPFLSPFCSDDDAWQVASLASQMCLAMCDLFPEQRSQTAFFVLFRRMDEDNSGRITFDEFLKMTREVLRIAGHMVSTYRLLCAHGTPPHDP